MRKQSIGLLFIITAIIFGLIETIYFGCNLIPNSISEIICDLILSGLFIIGYILIKK